MAETNVELSPRQTAAGCLILLGFVGTFVVAALAGTRTIWESPAFRPYAWAALAAMIVGVATGLWGVKLGPTPRKPASWREASGNAFSKAFAVGAVVLIYHALMRDPDCWERSGTVVAVLFPLYVLLARFPLRRLPESGREPPPEPLQ